MKNTISLLALAISCIICSACYYDKEDAIYPLTGFTNPCDSAATYSQAVQFIMTGNCTSCHNANYNSGGVALDTYNNVLHAAQTGSLMGTIQNKPGYIQMPPSTPMSACQINKLNDWINNQEPH